MFGLPIVVHIDKDYVGAFAALGGVLLGFVLENYRNKKTEKKELRKILIGIVAKINLNINDLYILKTKIVALDVSAFFNEISTEHFRKNLNLNDPIIKEKFESIESDINNNSSNSALGIEFLKLKANLHTNVFEFCCYRQCEEAQNILTEMSNYKYNFDDIKKMNYKEFESFDFKEYSQVIVKKIDTEYRDPFLNRLPKILLHEIEKIG